MKVSQTLIEKLKKFEACSLVAYKDAKGVWTIGYGHTAGVKQGDKITQYQAEQFLKEDLATFEAAAQKVKRLTTQGRFDAVVDFMYNCGIAAFNSSTLRKYIEYTVTSWSFTIRINVSSSTTGTPSFCALVSLLPASSPAST